ncbi:MAG: hypothetical protein NTV97_33660 [Alphaproteobacteria bacterium]|nr:hypothetical protein [Alphaproteobacteria bacterium]
MIDSPITIDTAPFIRTLNDLQAELRRPVDVPWTLIERLQILIAIPVRLSAYVPAEQPGGTVSARMVPSDELLAVLMALRERPDAFGDVCDA